MNKKKKVILIILCILLSLVIIATASFFTLQYLGKKNLHKDDKNITATGVTVEDDIVSYNGKNYKLNPDVVSILIMGVDKEDISDNKGYGKNGQADCIFVAAVNTKTKSIKMIPLSREIMVDVDTFSKGGIFKGVEHEQLCLAYAYGNTPEKSCENVMTSVSRVLYGINVSYYAAVDMKGLRKFTTTIGGVDVKSNENIGKFKAGENVTVAGDSALSFIRSRGEDLEANNRRMERQKMFLKGLVSKTANLVSEKFTRLATYYSTMSPYTTTNMSLSELTYLATGVLSRNLGSNIEYKTVTGTMNLGEHAEFTVDEATMLPIIFDCFYMPVK